MTNRGHDRRGFAPTLVLLGIVLAGCPAPRATAPVVPAAPPVTAAPAEATNVPAVVASPAAAEVPPSRPPPEPPAELAEYAEVTADVAAALSSASRLWVRTRQGCVAADLAPTDDAERAGAVQTCRRKRVRCERTLEVNQGALWLGSRLCEEQRGDGTSVGSMDAGSSASRASSPVRVEGETVVLGRTYRVWVEADDLVWETSRCEPGSVERARQRLLAEGTAEAGLTEALHERFGVVGDERRCLLHEGIALVARPLDETGTWDRGAMGRSRPEPTDCAAPCPRSAVLEDLRALNATLEGKVFTRRADAPRGEVYLSQPACEASQSAPWLDDQCLAGR